MSDKRRILIVDDEASVRRLLTEIAKKEGFIVETAENGQEAVEAVRAFQPHLVLMDLRMPIMDGMDAFDIIHQDFPDLPIVLLTAYGTVDTAVNAMRKGAFDYLVKPANVVEIRAVMHRVMAIASEPAETLAAIEISPVPDSIIGRSVAMQNVYKLVGRVAASSATVLITGESGSGKELIATTIHANSPRAEKPFIRVNCGVLPESLIESELFGHEKGAFTGAASRKPGRFELADGGTLFLDEIGELPLSLQVKLLRVLQEQEFERIGGTETVKVDVRILAATNRNLEAMIREGTFRTDLFYRLHVVPIRVPPLRERKEDIPLLANYFLQKFAQRHHCRIPVITPEANEALTAYQWPGNVRELANLIERAVIFSHGILDVTDLSFLLSQDMPMANESCTEAWLTRLLTLGSLKDMLDVVERQILTRVLLEHGGNRSRAAERLGISRRTLLYKLQEHDVTIRDGQTDRLGDESPSD